MDVDLPGVGPLAAGLARAAGAAVLEAAGDGVGRGCRSAHGYAAASATCRGPSTSRTRCRSASCASTRRTRARSISQQATRTRGQVARAAPEHPPARAAAEGRARLRVGRVVQRRELQPPPRAGRGLDARRRSCREGSSAGCGARLKPRRAGPRRPSGRVAATGRSMRLRVGSPSAETASKSLKPRRCRPRRSRAAHSSEVTPGGLPAAVAASMSKTTT